MPAVIQALMLLVLFLVFAPACIQGLEVAPNSPCFNTCTAGTTAATTAESIVCLDSEFIGTRNGSQFQQCVECELDSPIVDNSTGTPDVLWGLYNLRYTLSACMFGVPEQKVSLSSPCQVTCAPVGHAITQDLTNNPSTTNLSFCSEGNFSSYNVQQCVFCYGLMDEQKYLANFLQALAIACTDPPSSTSPFPVAASSIFNESTIQAPANSGAGSSASHHLSGTDLALAIALPIVFAAALLALACTGCFFFTRRRRRQMSSRGKMRRVHESWADSPVTPRTNHFNWDQVALDMEQLPGAKGSKRYSRGPYYSDSPQYAYRDDVGPGPGQLKDPQLHDQYFAPSPTLDSPDHAIGYGLTTDERKQADPPHPYHESQNYRTEPPNLLHSPDLKRDDFEDGVADGTQPYLDKKDHQNWI